MVTSHQKAKIVQLRGLGFGADEIAEKLHIRSGQVGYWERKIEQLAREEGEDEVFVRIMADGMVPEILRFMRIAAGFRRV